ncbi:MAG TPA: thioredoxin domain-containing protein [Campylobacterales bacterium]|nr:thioredoxin domain-containing protein [Campylobacterales bacterium]
MLRFVFLVFLALNLLWAKENALIHETSPYLLRHAHNPVNWYAWNEETLQRAQKENKPIFVSIGYSTCHWCHVMEEESFEHQDVADVLNRYFISIKVDKEEFPNIDKKYQNLFRAFNGRRGGWPLSVFLTPQLEPFFITTYMPRGSYGGAENILELTNRLGELYADREALHKALEKFSHAKETMNQLPQPSQSSLELSALIKTALERIEAQYDRENHGFATGRTKFPEASKIELLLNIYKTTEEQRALDMAKETLLTMSKRGIYDQVDGGFFRYSDKQWEIPHFQKLLYVNAQMPLPYMELYRLTGDRYFFEIAKATVDAIERRYVEDGYYFSASDSVGSDGVEGTYYTYLYDDVFEGLKKEGLNEEEIEAALSYLSIEDMGNLDGELAHVNVVGDKAPARLEEVKAYLGKLRTTREFPFVDKKIITSWSAMMIKTLYTLAAYEPSYLEVANQRLASLLALMYVKETLYHQTIPGKAPTQTAMLEDYAYLVDTLLTAYQVTLDKQHLERASRLAHHAKALFCQEGVWYMSTQTPKVAADFDDKYYSSPLSVLLNGFLSLANLHDDLALGEESRRMLKLYGKVLVDAPEESASFVTLALRAQVGVITLKATQKRLQQHHQGFMQMDYPFLLRKSHSFDEYMACQLGICFATGKTFEAINASITKAKEEISTQPKKLKWGK